MTASYRLNNVAEIRAVFSTVDEETLSEHNAFPGI